MKKLLLSISLLTIIISFQSCSKYEDNHGITIVPITMRLCLSEWTATKILYTNEFVTEADITRDVEYYVEFDDDGVMNTVLVTKPNSTNFAQGSDLSEFKWNWTDGKRSITSRDRSNGQIVEVWEILRLDTDNLWVNIQDVERPTESVYMTLTR